jgi:ABC-type multidrug transport system fused ATPase/permease subunit
MIKQKAVRLLKSNFKYLAFFYKYLKVRLIYIVLLSFFVSLLDALSLSMFIPLFEVASGHTNTAQASGLQSFLERFDVSLTINNILLLMLVFFLFKGVARYMDVYFSASISAYFIKNNRIRQLRLLSNQK